MNCRFCGKKLKPRFLKYCGLEECNRKRRNKAALDCIRKKIEKQKKKLLAEV